MSPAVLRIVTLSGVCLLISAAVVAEERRRTRTTHVTATVTATTRPTSRPTHPTRASQEEATRQRNKRLVVSRVRGLRMLETLRKRQEILNQQNEEREKIRRQRRARGT
jgi:hypothetical protein